MLQKLFAVLFSAVFAVAVGTLYPTHGLAQDNSQVEDVNTSQITGEVLKINQENEQTRLTIKSNNETKEITVPSGISVKKNTFETQIGEIKPGDIVTITTTQQDQVLGVSATSGGLADFGRWGIPTALLGALALIGLILYIQRSNKGRIKTTTDT